MVPLDLAPIVGRPWINKRTPINFASSTYANHLPQTLRDNCRGATPVDPVDKLELAEKVCDKTMHWKSG